MVGPTIACAEISGKNWRCQRRGHMKLFLRLMDPNTQNPWPSETDTFKFDLQGFVISRNFLTEKEVGEMNALLDPVCARFTGNSKFDFVSENVRFLELMCDRRVLAACSAWIGGHFRFAEAWGIHGRPQNRNLHAGPFSAQNFNQYHVTGGRRFCSCLVFAVVLTEQRSGDGGLVLLPGSHKVTKHESGDHVFRRIFNSQMDPDCIVQPALRPGDVVFFAEAMMHGTECWVPVDRVRRNLYYKFTHSFCTYLPDDDIQLQRLRSLARNEQEKRMLETPWVRSLGGSDVKGSILRPGTVVATD